ncbi:MAG: SPOR domain-containing protein [Chitinophagales bacterium]|nr:SPOR domain-containing protein [Chitinophagales bacterium]
MKKKYLLLAVMAILMLPTSSMAQTAKTSKNKPTTVAAPKADETLTVFRIKLGAFKNPDLKKFEALKPAKNGVVTTEDAGNGLTRVLIGDFDTEAKANESLEAIKKAGYPEAFVTKRKVTATTTTTTATTPTKNAPTEAAIDDTKYMIQLGVMPEPTTYSDFSNLVDIGQLYSERVDKNFRLSIGTFTGKEAANKALAKVKKRGYDEAFLRPIEEKKPAKNEEKSKETKK